MPTIQLDVNMQRMLLVDWFTKLAREAGMIFTNQGSNNLAFTIGPHDGFHIVARFIDQPPFLEFISSDPTRQPAILQIAQKAMHHSECFDFGGRVWYSVGLQEVEFKFFPFPLKMGSFLQRLSGQARILGWRKLGGGILLEFRDDAKENPPNKEQPFAPKANVIAHIPAPGPCRGHFSSFVAESFIDTVVSICTLALGRAVEHPIGVYPAEDTSVPMLEGRMADPTIGYLARKGVSLNIFDFLPVDGGLEVFQRIEAALTTFTAATRQEHDTVAAILYVASGECLAMPKTTWRLRRTSKRFVDFFDELMPDTIDRIVSHSNFEGALGVRRGTREASALRREALKRMYSYRSLPLHEGLRPRHRGLGATFDLAKHARRALLADFAEAAIMRYLSAPRSSLIGDPQRDVNQRASCQSVSGPGTKQN